MSITNSGVVKSPFNVFNRPEKISTTGNGAIALQYLKRTPGGHAGIIPDPLSSAYSKDQMTTLKSNIYRAKGEIIKNEKQARINQFNNTGNSRKKEIPVSPGAKFTTDYTRSIVYTVSNRRTIFIILGVIFIYLFILN